MRLPALLAVMLVPLAVGGCTVGTAAGIVAAPFKVGAQVVDWTTTSRDESDRNYGRKVRKQRKAEQREYRGRCRRDRAACDNFADYRPPNT